MKRRSENGTARTNLSNCIGLSGCFNRNFSSGLLAEDKTKKRDFSTLENRSHCIDYRYSSICRN